MPGIASSSNRPPLVSSRAAPGSVGIPAQAGELQSSPGHAEDSSAAFSRVDLAVVLAALAVLAAVALPVLGGSEARSEQVTCANNLRWIGRAFQEWSVDFSDQRPWRVPFSDGGLSPVGNQGPLPAWWGQARNVWFQFMWVSNQLSSARVVACPSDVGVKVASNFAATIAASGLAHGAFQHKAVSYFIGLETLPAYPLAVLGGDRNLPTNGLSGCAAFEGMGNLTAEVPVPASNIAWLPAHHGDRGNLLLNDGRVWQVSNAELRRTLEAGEPDNGSLHFLMPQR